MNDASFFGAWGAPSLTQRKAGAGPLGMLGAMPSSPAPPSGPHQALLVRAALPGTLSASAADLIAVPRRPVHGARSKRENSAQFA
jgi:hypothetical protein